MQIVNKMAKIKQKTGKFAKTFLGELRGKGPAAALKWLSSKVLWKFREQKYADNEIRHPRPVQENKLVFESYGDYGDNARALCEYMLQQDCYSDFEFVWLIDDPERYKAVLSPRIRAVRRKLPNGHISLEALQEIHSARYVFYTVNVNWAKVAQKDQVFVNLWHGCSFKDNKGNGRIFFDYLLVTSPFFRELKQKYWNIPDYQKDKILGLGYPRYDVLKTGSPEAGKLVSGLKKKKGCDKVVIWMPTFRKSDSERLNEHSLDESRFNLPIVLEQSDFEQINDVCVRNKVLLVLKKHRLHKIGGVNTKELSNIIYIDDRWLDKKQVQLYEFLHETDAMITDYSSAGIDYLLLDRPIGFTLDDYEMYRQSRGFTVEDPLEYMPGKHIYDIEDFKAFIAETGENQDPLREKRREVAEILHTKCDCYCRSLLNHLNLLND